MQLLVPWVPRAHKTPCNDHTLSFRELFVRYLRARLEHPLEHRESLALIRLQDLSKDDSSLLIEESTGKTASSEFFIPSNPSCPARDPRASVPRANA